MAGYVAQVSQARVRGKSVRVTMGVVRCGVACRVAVSYSERRASADEARRQNERYHGSVRRYMRARRALLRDALRRAREAHGSTFMRCRRERISLRMASSMAETGYAIYGSGATATPRLDACARLPSPRVKTR